MLQSRRDFQSVLRLRFYQRVCGFMSIERGFQFQGFYSLLNVPLSLSRGTIFRRQKNPRRGYRPKITGILFVCNEAGRSVAYCAHMMLW